MKSKKYIYALAIILIVLSSLVMSVEWTAFSKSFYKKQYEKLNTAENMQMSQEDLFTSTDILLDYITDKEENIDLEVVVNGEKVEMFNQKEKDHMIDVKNLYQGVKSFKYLALGFAFVIVLIGIKTKDINNARLLKESFRMSAIILAVFIGVIVFYSLIDFNAFWIKFHEIFFTNDLWLLDPYTDRMINMFPEVFFNQMVLRIILNFLVINSIFILIYKKATGLKLEKGDH